MWAYAYNLDRLYFFEEREKIRMKRCTQVVVVVEHVWEPCEKMGIQNNKGKTRNFYMRCLN